MAKRDLQIAKSKGHELNHIGIDFHFQVSTFFENKLIIQMSAMNWQNEIDTYCDVDASRIVYYYPQCLWLILMVEMCRSLFYFSCTSFLVLLGATSCCDGFIYRCFKLFVAVLTFHHHLRNDTTGTQTGRVFPES